MKQLIIGGDSFLGREMALIAPEAMITSRRLAPPPRTNICLRYDFLKDTPIQLPAASVLYLVAGFTKFRDCELNPDAYRVNVDAQADLAAHFRCKFGSHVVYVSSEAAEWPNQTAYGSQKRACEAMLTAICGYKNLSIMRPGQIKDWSVTEIARLVIEAGVHKMAGIQRWQARQQENGKTVPIMSRDAMGIIRTAQSFTFAKDVLCASHPHGCRLSSDGSVCTERCEWVQRELGRQAA